MNPGHFGCASGSRLLRSRRAEYVKAFRPLDHAESRAILQPEGNEMNEDTILGLVVKGGRAILIRKRDWARVQSHAVVMASGCHVVDYSPSRTFGYCATKVNGEQVYVHRLAYAATYGGIPAGLIIRHRCDNPRCINPVHLEPGTHRDNTQDMIKRGRDNFGGRKNKQ